MDFRSFLQQNRVILDGGMGTLLQEKGLKPGQFPETWNLSHPAEIVEIHKAYFDAGSNVVCTNTFGANTLKFDPARKAALKKTVYEDRATPDFGREAERITFGDGCKVVFTDGSWVICRFSGTEPLLRIAAEGNTKEQAQSYVRAWKEFLEI